MAGRVVSRVEGGSFKVLLKCCGLIEYVVSAILGLYINVGKYFVEKVIF